MEGASWVANKSLQEANKHHQKLESLKYEFDRRANACITEPEIHEINGRDFLKLRDWTSEFLVKEAGENKLKYETLLENVNYNLAQANETFAKRK